MTEEILDEVRRNLLKMGRITDSERADRLVERIRRAFPSSMVAVFVNRPPLLTHHRGLYPQPCPASATGLLQ